MLFPFMRLHVGDSQTLFSHFVWLRVSAKRLCCHAAKIPKMKKPGADTEQFLDIRLRSVLSFCHFHAEIHSTFAAFASFAFVIIPL